MKKKIILFALFISIISGINAQDKLDDILPVRGLCIPAPDKETVEPFVRFIEEELHTMKVNTLVLRIGYNYEYESHPELWTDKALSKNVLRQTYGKI